MLAAVRKVERHVRSQGDRPAQVPHRGLITIAIMLATVMQVLDTTIANVALPSMMGDLGASQDTITWVLTSYIVAAAIMTPVTGWLSDRFGRKELFLTSVVGFVVTRDAEGGNRGRRRGAQQPARPRRLGEFADRETRRNHLHPRPSEDPLGQDMRRLLRDVARGNTPGGRDDAGERRDRGADPRPGRDERRRSDVERALTPAEAAFVADARVGHLGTQRMGKWPHVVPVCHVLDLDRVVIASALRRKIEDIRENASVTYCVDAYSEDWDDGLAQVVVSGEAYLIESGPEFAARPRRCSTRSSRSTNGSRRSRRARASSSSSACAGPQQRRRGSAVAVEEVEHPPHVRDLPSIELVWWPSG